MAKGTKFCPKCKTATGCRTINCKKEGCGHVFGSAVIENGYCDPNAAPKEVWFPADGNIVFTPAGKCPVKFTGNVQDFVNKICSGRKEDKYHPAAIMYWLNQQLPADQFNAYRGEVYTYMGVAA